MTEDQLLNNIQEFLQEKGYGIMVIGSMRIEQREQGIKKYKYEFVVDFVGKKKEEK